MAEIISFPTVGGVEKEFKREEMGVFSRRLGAELILEDGSRRYFRCRSTNKENALTEVLTFVGSVERTTGDSVMWRFKGESTYHMGSNTPEEYSKKGKVKALLNYFFDLD